MKEIYDYVYKNVPGYDPRYQHKFDVVDKQFIDRDKNIKIIDIGCGKGHYIRNLLNQQFTNIIGIEFSSECAAEFLTDVPHINVDFLDHSTKISDNEYDVGLCMDVLEHIPYENINQFIKEINRISSESILGIANHSDMFFGNELHLIQEDSTWWYNKLNEYYPTVELLYETSSNRFFVFKCLK